MGSVNSILFSVGPVKFYLSGMIIVAGVAVGYIISWLGIKYCSSKKDNYVDDLVSIFMVSLLGAKFFFLFLNWGRFYSFWEMFYYWQPGMVTYGGILAGTLFTFWVCLQNEQRIWAWLDNLMLGLFSGLAVGVTVYNLVMGYMVDYSIFWLFVTFVYLTILRVWYYSKYQEGLIYLFGLGSYSLMQLTLGIDRLNNSQWLINLNNFISLVVLIGCISMIYYLASKKPFIASLKGAYLSTKRYIKQKRP